MARRTHIGRLRRLWPKRGWLATLTGKRVALGIVVILLAAVPLAVRIVPLGLVEGEPAPRDITAPRTIQYVDDATTAALREAASNAVSPVYVFDKEAQSEARSSIVGFFAAVSSARSSESQDSTAQASYLVKTYGSTIGTDTIAAVLALSDESLETVARNVEVLVAGTLSTQIREDDLAAVREQYAASVDLMPLSIPERYAVIAVGNAFLEPTVIEDAAATERARAEAASAVSPYVIVISEGENIVSSGDVVTALDLDIVKTLGGLELGTDLASTLAGIVLMSLLIVAVGAYLAYYEEGIWRKTRSMMLIASLFLGVMYITRAMTIIAPSVSPYLMPVPLAAILLTLLIGPRPALLLTVLTTIGTQLLGFSGTVQVIVTLVTTVCAVAALSRIHHRAHLFYAGGFMVALLGFVSFAASFASGNDPETSLTAGAYGLAGGLATAVLMVGLMPFLEFAFGVTSDITLLELGSPGHPLLRRLMTEAPGTYAHSVMTGNLAESAAETIGANPLLARAGAYFHDVGKVRRPAFFAENQAGGENPHDVTPPALSARIITAHVREGVELAAEHKLPTEVVDIVRQHHGTSVVSYFYDKAAKRGRPVVEADFRYDGSRPTSREAALVMLADSAEAAVRALEEPTPENIEGRVRRIVRTKVEDHQLDESGLTLGDIEQAISVYTRILSSVYHPRIEYPEPPEEKEQHASQYRQPQGA